MALMHSLKHSQQCGMDKPAECSERIQHHSRMVHVPVVVITNTGKLLIFHLVHWLLTHWLSNYHPSEVQKNYQYVVLGHTLNTYHNAVQLLSDVHIQLSP